MLLFIFLALLAEAIMAAPVNVSALDPPLASSTVFQFPDVGTWIENVAARENGDLLLTMVQPKPRLYSLKGPQTPKPELSLLFEFPDMDGLLGITEVRHDVFVVAGGHFHGEADPVLGTFSLWNISFADRFPTVAKIVDLPDDVFPNGLVTVPSQRDVILVANSLGSLLRVDVYAGTMETIAADPEMVPVPGALFPLGINGIKILDGYVWWTNSFASTIYRRRIDAAGRIAEKSSVESIATLSETFLDDFTVGPDSSLYLMTNPNNTVISIGKQGNDMVVAGAQQESIVAGAIAGAFGRTSTDRHILYVVTDGGLASPVNGTFVEPAKIVAVDTSRLADSHVVCDEA